MRLWSEAFRLAELTSLEHRLHFLHRPAFAGSDHVHPGAPVHEHVRTYLVVGRHDGEFGLGLPAERKVEVTREYLPTRTVVEFDDVALGMRSDLHDFPRST